jgi:4'-phosphopantetheinyl transferase EntD
VIDELIPPPAVTAYLSDDPEAAFTELYPQEADAIARAVPKRRREYATVRLCARRALTRLGAPAGPPLAGRRGAPQWPAGVVGSMTHCDGYRAAAVAHSSAFAGLGIDAEPNGPLPEGVLEAVSLPGERVRLAELSAARPEVSWDRLLFSAKEAVFKTWYPLTLRELGFDEAEIRFDPVTGAFLAQLLVPGPRVGGRRLDVFHGRWLCRKDLVVTAIALPRAA